MIASLHIIGHNVSCCSTPRHQPRSTAALASALYNSGPATSGSFNSSGRSSNCDDGDIHSDISIEEDVMELNTKVRQLQDQVSCLSENQAANDERYSRVKADNVTLTAKIHILEENIREIEMRGEERLGEEQRRNRELIQRMEREKQLEIENYTIRLQVRRSSLNITDNTQGWETIQIENSLSVFFCL